MKEFLSILIGLSVIAMLSLEAGAQNMQKSSTKQNAQKSGSTKMKSSKKTQNGQARKSGRKTYSSISYVNVKSAKKSSGTSSKKRQTAVCPLNKSKKAYNCPSRSKAG